MSSDINGRQFDDGYDYIGTTVASGTHVEISQMGYGIKQFSRSIEKIKNSEFNHMSINDERLSSRGHGVTFNTITNEKNRILSDINELHENLIIIRDLFKKWINELDANSNFDYTQIVEDLVEANNNALNLELINSEFDIYDYYIDSLGNVEVSAEFSGEWVNFFGEEVYFNEDTYFDTNSYYMNNANQNYDFYSMMPFYEEAPEGIPIYYKFKSGEAVDVYKSLYENAITNDSSISTIVDGYSNNDVYVAIEEIGLSGTEYENMSLGQQQSVLDVLEARNSDVNSGEPLPGTVEHFRQFEDTDTSSSESSVYSDERGAPYTIEQHSDGSTYTSDGDGNVIRIDYIDGAYAEVDDTGEMIAYDSKGNKLDTSSDSGDGGGTGQTPTVPQTTPSSTVPSTPTASAPATPTVSVPVTPTYSPAPAPSVAPSATPAPTPSVTPTISSDFGSDDFAAYHDEISDSVSEMYAADQDMLTDQLDDLGYSDRAVDKFMQSESSAVNAVLEGVEDSYSDEFAAIDKNFVSNKDSIISDLKEDYTANQVDTIIKDVDLVKEAVVNADLMEDYNIDGDYFDRKVELNEMFYEDKSELESLLKSYSFSESEITNLMTDKDLVVDSILDKEATLKSAEEVVVEDDGTKLYQNQDVPQTSGTYEEVVTKPLVEPGVGTVQPEVSAPDLVEPTPEPDGDGPVINFDRDTIVNEKPDVIF